MGINLVGMGINPVKELRELAGMTRRAAAAWLGLDERTLRRQEHGETAPQGPVLQALRMRQGNLAEVHEAWRGWRLAPDGRLYHEGMASGIDPGEVLAIPWERQRIRVLEEELEKARWRERLAKGDNDAHYGAIEGMRR